MAAGKRFVIKLTETSTSAVELTEVSMIDIDDTNMTGTQTTVHKNDFTDTLLDQWVVYIDYQNGNIPATSTTLLALEQLATTAINAKYSPVAEIVSL